ncbi:MAG: hypothetical protein FJ318_00220 [SAR202 cluster bacterium]|nr:hypothetical protein [SAR202 cluster bacterium]
MTSPAPVMFVHITDTHILPSPEARYHGVDTAATLRRVVAEVVELETRPAFALVSGDLTDGGEPEAYARLAGILQPLRAAGMPVLHALGNHDNRPAFWATILGRSYQPPERHRHAVEVGGLRLIVLDSLIEGEIDGEVGDD